MDKNLWISNKISKLIEEGKSKEQSIAIALNMWSRGDHMQEGGLPTAQQGLYFANGQDLYGNMVKNMNQPPNIDLVSQTQSPQQDFSKMQPQPAPPAYTGIPSTNMPPLDQAGYNTNRGYDPKMGYTDYKQGDMNGDGKVDEKDKVDKFGQPSQGVMGGAEGDAQSQDWIKYNILNPYKGGMDLNTSLAYTGQQFGQGKTGMGVMGAGLSLLKGARSFLSGYGAGKGQQNLEKSYHENQFNRDEDLYRRTDNYQQGGEFDNEMINKYPAYVGAGTGLVFPNTVIPGQEAQNPTIVPIPTPAQAATTIDETKGFDKNSIRDTWEKKTGLPWSEAKRLGYTSGTAGDNTKLLEELNDPRFRKEALRSKPFTASNFKQEAVDIMQQGGLTQADLLTGNYMTGEGQQNPNVEVEGGEHTKNSLTGQVQEVVGDKHVEGGEKVELQNKSKVLSDYTKIGASNANIFSEMFDVKVKAGDTFATVLDRYNTKIGVKTLEAEEKELLEKLEKNTKTSMDKSTKQINEDFLAQEIAEINKKKEAINKLKAQAFETIFAEQEKVPKKGDGTQILNKAGNPIKQMGGYKEDDEYYQEGGQPQGGVDPQQVAQALQGGADPNQVVQQLVQAGVSQEEAVGMVQQIVQQLQGAQPKGGQPTMRDGGMYEDLTYHQTKPIVEEKPYTFQTQYTPTVEGYDVKGTSVLNQPMLSDVEYMQHRTGKGYGQKMADVEKTIGTHGWYFDTEAKKKAFREAIVKPDAGGVVKDFQNAYNQEATKRGKAAGLNDEQIAKLITDVGFTGTGVQQFDDKFGAFTSTRPLFDFSKVEPKPTPPTEPTPEAGTVPRDVVKNIVPMEGMPYVMPPSAPIAPYLQQVDLSRLESRKGSVENQLQASENARQAAYEATKGLPPAQAAAMMANYLATSGQQDVQGIANQEIADTTDRVRTEQYNAGQLDKEKLLNEQLKKQYEREAFGTLNVNEQNWRNYYDANEANRQALSDKIERRNIMNLGLTNYQLNGDGGFEFVNKSPFSGADPAIAQYTKWFQTLTPEQQIAERKRKYEAMSTNTPPATGNVVDLTKYKI